MATEAVFNTTELLEDVLALLPLLSLLRVQAVSKQWRDCIKTSTLLQQKLFLKPTKEEKVWLVDITNLPAQAQPLRRDFKAFVLIKAAVPCYSEALKAHHGLTVKPVRINPFIVRRVDEFARANIDAYAYHGTEIELMPLADSEIEAQTGYLPLRYFKLGESSSMSDPLLTQPPVRHVSLEMTIRRPNADFDMCFSRMSNDSGIRLKDVVSEMKKAAGDDVILGHTIYMHGGMEATEQDEEVVKKRTETWRKSLSTTTT